MTQKDKSKWEERYRDKRFVLKWPDEAVVRFLARFPDSGQKRTLLDVGCGTGRHSRLSAMQGFTVCGCDFSEAGLKIAGEQLLADGLSAAFQTSRSHELPYQSHAFDVVLAFHSIYYNSFANMVQTIEEIHRVLRPGGWALVSLLTGEDYRKSEGETQDGKTYVNTKGGHGHLGLTYCIVDSCEEFTDLFKNKFTQQTIGRAELSFDLNQRTCHWLVSAQKPDSS